MTLQRRLTTIALLLAVLGACPAYSSDADFAWLDGLSLVLLETDTAAELHAATNAIHAAGGRVGLMSLPNVLVGWIPPQADASLAEQLPIRQILREAPAVAKTQATDPRTRRMLRWFYEVQTGAYQQGARERQEASKGAPPFVRPADGLSPEPADPVDFLRNLQANGFDLNQLRDRGLILPKSGPGLPQITGNSDRMTGTVSVSLLFVESDGSGADANLYTWTEQHMQSYINGVNSGMLWWSQQASIYNNCWAAFFVHYIPGTDVRNQQWREMILHNSADVSAMASEVMGNHGYNSGSHFSRVEAFNTAQRANYGTNWAYTAFVAYNPPPAAAALTDGKSAFAYLLGPYTFLLYRSFSWDANQVFTHESGHIFGACDEYADGCTACNTCLGELNNNCENCAGGNNSCMMKANSFTLCSYTDEQLGWHDLNPCAAPVLAAPVLSSLSPSSIAKGVAAVINLTGSNFLHGAFTNFGAGVTVDSTTVVGPSSALAYVRVSAQAPISMRNASLSNRDLQAGTLTNGFEVVDTPRHYFSVTGSNVFPYLTPEKAANNWADAIAAADSGDSVLVEAGSIGLSGGYVLSRGVALYGAWTNNFTTRDLTNNKTILNLTGGTLSVVSNDPVAIDGFILENGSGGAAVGGGLIAGDYGGAVQVNNSDLTMRHCIVRNNVATDGTGFSGGGGLFANNSTLVVDNCSFANNAANRGGALYLFQSSASISSSIFTGNAIAKAVSDGVTPFGAGIMLEACSGGVTLQDVLVDGNTGAEKGGGIYVLSCAAVQVLGGAIENHLVTAASLPSGGGLEIVTSDVTLTGVRIAHNTSGFFSGGLNATASTLVLQECVFDSNSASLQGALGVAGGTLDLRHCFFRGNIASITAGAGLLNTISSGSVLGNTLWGNQGAGGTGGLALSSASLDVRNNIVANSVGHGINCAGTPPTSMDYNLVWGSSGNDWDACSAGANSLSADPLFVDAVQGDMHLAVHSPALDRGDPDVGLQDPDGSRGDLGGYGSHAFVMQQPAAPQGLAASSAGSDILLSWSANSEADLQSYVVYCDTIMDLVPSASTYLTTVAAADTSINLGALPCNWFTLAAVNDQGYSSGFGAPVHQEGVPSDSQQPATYRFQLHPNTPNPFNPNTRIDFELDRPRHVRVAVYDLAGRLVRRLVERSLQPGRHNTVWDGRDARGVRVASGVYFYRLESGDLLQTRKMVLLK